MPDREQEQLILEENVFGEYEFTAKQLLLSTDPIDTQNNGLLETI